MQVIDFVYNGFTVAMKKSVASFTAEFKEWTTDPGVANCKCSDGRERLIPTLALVGFRIDDYPPQNKSKAKKATRKFGVYFGIPSTSITPPPFAN
jgi:hypothetical protein